MKRFKFHPSRASAGFSCQTVLWKPETKRARFTVSNARAASAWKASTRLQGPLNNSGRRTTSRCWRLRQSRLLLEYPRRVA